MSDDKRQIGLKAVAASKEVIVRQAMKELNEAQEAGARSSYAAWMKKVQQDMEGARQHVLKQGKEVSERLDGMAVSTIERVQRNMEASRTEAVDRFVSRLRDQVLPLIAEAKDALQTLAASETNLKTESQAIYAGLESQIVSSANASLAKVHEELEKNSAAAAAKTSETLVRVSQDLEKAARDNLQSLLVSMGRQITKTLEQRTAEISREFSTGLEGYTRNYLESVGKAIAGLPTNTPKRSSS